MKCFEYIENGSIDPKPILLFFFVPTWNKISFACFPKPQQIGKSICYVVLLPARMSGGLIY